jgi:hypothetical protein
VPDVQQIETSVRESDRAASVTIRLDGGDEL